jgi:hypothetical protein
MLPLLLVGATVALIVVLATLPLTPETAGFRGSRIVLPRTPAPVAVPGCPIVVSNTTSFHVRLEAGDSWCAGFLLPLGSTLQFEWGTFGANVTVVGWAWMCVTGCIVPLEFNHEVYNASGTFGESSFRMTPEWLGTAYEVGLWPSGCGGEFLPTACPGPSPSNVTAYVTGPVT